MNLEELSLFDFTPTFDPAKAKWRKGVDDHKYCKVIAYIPEDALSPMEQNYSGPGNRLKEQRHRIWCDHSMAILQYLGVEAKWEEATRLLKKHKDTREPIRMIIKEWNMKSFKQTQIVEYL